MLRSSAHRYAIVCLLCRRGKNRGGTTADNAAPVYALDAVVVTANRTPQKITETNADISVVTRQEIETMHMQNVEEALRTVPGVQFLSYGASNTQVNMNNIRLNGSDDIVVLIDGVRMTDFKGSNKSGQISSNLLSNMDNIERIEVLRGAAGTVYGSGAKGGVINIITRKVNTTRSTIDISGGDFGRKNYNFNAQGKVDKLTYNAYYGYNIQGDIKDPRGTVWPGKLHTKNIGTSLAYKFNDKSTLSFLYNNSKTDFDAYDIIRNQDRRNSKRYENDMTLRHDYVFSDLWKNSLTYRRSREYYRINQYYESFDQDMPIESRYAYRFLSDQLTYDSGKHNLIMGFDYSSGVNRQPMQLSGPVPTRMSNMSIYAQESWHILPKLTLTGGLRYDKPSSEGFGASLASHTSKSYKISYKISPKDVIYAGRSDFYILPSLDQLSNSIWGNPSLKPAYGRTSSIGYNRIFSDRNQISIDWFYTKTDRGIGMSEQEQYEQSYGETARGWNAQWSTQLDQHWSANIGWAHLNQKSSQYYDTFSNQGYQPKDAITFGVYYHGNKWSGGLDGFYFMRRMDRIDSTLPNGGKAWPADKYGVFNLSANYQATDNLMVYMKVENIFNKLWAEATDVMWGYGPDAFYAQPKRNLLVGMQYKF